MFKNDGNCLELTKQLEIKEKECEELKAEVDRCRGGWCNSEIKKIWYQQAEQAMQEKNFDLKIKLDKYKQTLTTIERHFDKRCDVCREENGIEASCDVCWKKDIKDIINKAKEEE